MGGAHEAADEVLFTVEQSLQRFADDIGVAVATVEKWRWTASRWPVGQRRPGISFSVFGILASVRDEAATHVTTSASPSTPKPT